MKEAPVLFVSHGSPMFAVQPGLLGPTLQRLGGSLGELTAILIVSAHWQTRGVRVMTTAHPATLHDFGGFPDELYRIRYPATGAPAVARRAGELLTRAGFTVREDDERPLDHGAWVPLLYLSPTGATPVFQVSLPVDLDAQRALAMGAALAPLRTQGVMIVGSGSLTHNLRDYFSGAAANDGYAQAFAAWVRSVTQNRDLLQLQDYRQRAPGARQAHPTEEHFQPLLVAAGATTSNDTLTVLEGGMDGVLSMDSLLWTAMES